MDSLIIVMFSVFVLLIPLALLIRSKRNKKTDESQNLVAQFPPDNTSVVPPLSKTSTPLKISGGIVLTILILIGFGFLIAFTDRTPGAPLAMGFALGVFPILAVAGIIAFIGFLVSVIIAAAKTDIPEPEQNQEQTTDQNQEQEQKQEQNQNQSQGQQQQE
jgi:hypothetical protein